MTEKRNVLFVVPQPFFEWRGSPIRVGFNAQALAELGYGVDLLVMPVGQDREIPGVRILRIPNVLRVKNLAIGPSPVKAILDLFLFAKALGLAYRNRYDVIHGVEDAGPIAIVVAWMTGARAVFEKHSDPASYKRGPLRNLVMWLYGKVEAFSIRRAAAVIGTGPGLVAQARAIKPDVEAHHIFDIPSSLVEPDEARVRDVRSELRQDPGETLITYVGSFAVYQGIDLMFDSMPAVVQADPGARFIVIGGSPDEIAERKAWLAGKRIDTSVTFVGKVPPDELPNYLAASDILLSPRTAGNNTPLKLLDYLKAGRAIVATDNDANRLILDETTAVLVQPNPDDFSGGIEKLLNDEGLRERLAQQGGALIRDTYNFPEFKRRLGVCYRGVLG